ncbi:MAG: hypothetical protein ACI9W2_001924, partial [Gammaproteobacteria bacterium]
VAWAESDRPLGPRRNVPAGGPVSGGRPQEGSQLNVQDRDVAHARLRHRRAVLVGGVARYR